MIRRVAYLLIDFSLVWSDQRVDAVVVLVDDVQVKMQRVTAQRVVRGQLLV
jgi:hypothetical protein